MASFEQSANKLSDLITTVFADASAEKHYLKLLEELEEMKKEMDSGSYTNLAVEIADCIGCLIGIAVKSGISANGLIAAFIAKTEINTRREWKKNPDGTYSHIAAEPVQTHKKRV